MVRRILFTACLVCCSLIAAAQQSLNIYTTTSGTVCFTFAEKPSITFPNGQTLVVTTSDTTVEFPFSEVDKITFEDGVTAVESITMSKENSQIFIYDISGKLVLRSTSREGAAMVDLSGLRPGTYVVKDGKRTYKIMKR